VSAPKTALIAVRRALDRSLLEGLEQCLIINRLDVPRSLHQRLATSNILHHTHSGVRASVVRHK
jgi:hypothetical protein